MGVVEHREIVTRSGSKYDDLDVVTLRLDAKQDGKS